MSKLFFVSLHQVTVLEDEMYHNKQKDSANVWLDVYVQKKEIKNLTLLLISNIII